MEQKETVLIDIKIEGTESEAKINSLSSAILKLQEENKKLAESNKALAKSEGDNTQEIAKNTSQIEANKQQISQASATRKGLIQTIVAEDNSIKALQVRNAELIRQRNNLNTSTEEGRRKIADLNKQINANNDTIKENSSNLEQNRMNVGNYKQGFIDAFGAIKNTIPALGGVTKAQEGFNLALNKNPIGAVVMLLVGLKELFGGNAKVADTLSFAMTGINKAFQFIIDSAVELFEPITKVFTEPKKFATDLLTFLKDNLINRFKAFGVVLEGLVNLDFKKVADGVIQFGSGIENATDKAADFINKAGDFANKVGDAAKAGYDAAASQDGLALALAKSNRAIKENEISIQSLEKSLKDRTKSEKERIAIANQIADLEIKNANEREAIAKRNLDVEEALLKGKQLSGDEEAKLEDLRTEVFVANSEARIIEAERATRINKLLAAEEKSDKKELLAAQKEYEKQVIQSQINLDAEREALHQKEMERMQSELLALDERLKKEQELVNSVQITGQVESETADELDANTKRAIQNGRDRVKNRTVSDTQILQSATATTNALVGLFQKESTFGRIAKSGQAIVNTWLGVTSILKDETLPTLLKPFAIATNIATGLGAVAQINKVNFGGAFAGGGDFYTKGPTLLMVGDNPGGVERVSVTPISGRGQTIANGNTIAMAGGGTLTTGMDINSAYQSASNSANMANLINQVKTVLVLQDFEAVQMSRNNDIDRATVIL